jgi:hypothetical protein
MGDKMVRQIETSSDTDTAQRAHKRSKSVDAAEKLTLAHFCSSEAIRSTLAVGDYEGCRYNIQMRARKERRNYQLYHKSSYHGPRSAKDGTDGRPIPGVKV